MSGEVWDQNEWVMLPTLSYVCVFTAMKPNRIYPPNCRAAVYLIPLRWRPDYWPEEFPKAWWKDLHPKKPSVCGKSAPRYYRGRDEKVVWEIWQGRWSLHTQGQRLWLHQTGEWSCLWGGFVAVVCDGGVLPAESRCSATLLIKSTAHFGSVGYGVSFYRSGACWKKQFEFKQLVAGFMMRLIKLFWIQLMDNMTVVLSYLGDCHIVWGCQKGIAVSIGCPVTLLKWSMNLGYRIEAWPRGR